MIGKTISHYKILEKLGEGGMGVVYKARDIQLQRLVALKFLPPHIAEHPEEKARFIHEAQSASALNHTNVTTIYGIEESPEGMFIAMEYVEGRTLKQIIEEENLSIKKVLDIGIQMCEGIAMAHEKGVVHRDIKSDNVMVTPRGQVKIMDFGLAKLKGATKITQTGSTLGTAAYMSPEQASGEEVDQRSDIFSVGVVLYELLTRQLPFKGEHQGAIVYSIINEEPQPVARFNNQVSAKLNDIVFKALAKDKEERYQHIDDLLADLRRERKELEYVKTGHITVQASPIAKPKSNGWKVGVAGFLGMIIVGVSIYLIMPKSEPIESMAVLPFVNTGTDSSSEYLSDGFTESLINILSKLPGVRMMSASSVFRLKGKDIDPQKAASDLGVAAVLTGRVTQRGDDLSVSVELIKAKDNSHIWGERYDRKLSDIITLQADISNEISNQLKVTLNKDEQQRFSKPPTENIEAYQLYVKGRYFWNKRSKEGFEKAIQCLSEAVEKDPSYALAYVGLAEVYTTMHAWSLMSLKEATEKARAAARKALSLDESLGEPHVTLASCFEDDRDWTDAEREYRRALELSPNYATGHQWYGEFLRWRGRSDEAMAELRKAQELDPLSPIMYVSMAMQLRLLRRYDEGVQQVMKAFEIDQNFYPGHYALAWLYLSQGKGDDAIREAKKTIELSDSSLSDIGLLGFIYGSLGQRDKAYRILRKLLQMEKQTYIPPMVIGDIYLSMGERDEAFVWYNRAVDEREDINLGDPIYEPIRGDPRFAELLKKAGLSQ